MRIWKGAIMSVPTTRCPRCGAEVTTPGPARRPSCGATLDHDTPPRPAKGERRGNENTAVAAPRAGPVQTEPGRWTPARGAKRAPGRGMRVDPSWGKWPLCIAPPCLLVWTCCSSTTRPSGRGSRRSPSIRPRRRPASRSTARPWSNGCWPTDCGRPAVGRGTRVCTQRSFATSQPSALRVGSRRWARKVRAGHVARTSSRPLSDPGRLGRRALRIRLLGSRTVAVGFEEVDTMQGVRYDRAA